MSVVSMKYCICGKVISNDATTCRECWKARVGDIAKLAMNKEEVKTKLRKAALIQFSNPKYGALHSKRIKELWACPSSAYNNGRNEKLSNTYKRKLQDPEFLEKLSLARESNNYISSLEMQFIIALNKLGVIYDHQYTPPGCDKRYDFHLVTYNVLIEVDGWYWHNSPIAFSYGVPKKDEYKDMWALSHGYDMYRISEKAIKYYGAEEIINHLLQLLNVGA